MSQSKRRTSRPKKTSIPREPRNQIAHATSEELLATVTVALEQVRTKSLDLSFNELLDMYRNDELVIHPSFQRLFRWSTEKQSQFIESLVLELPIPPIYVVEEDDGKYELIDGLQRFSSYLHFRGFLKKRDSEELRPPLQLDGCDVVPALNGATYEALPVALQIRLKRMTVSTQVLRKESNTELRYHMFKRLNRGGERLSDQEVRNATIRLLGTRFNDFLQLVAKNPDFMSCTDYMTDEAKEQMGREECVLRFFAFKNDRAAYVKLIAPFLDTYMERMTAATDSFEYDKERRVFEETFRVLHQACGADVFAIMKGGVVAHQFAMAHFDMITLGIQKELARLTKLSAKRTKALGQSLLELKRDPDFVKQTKGGGKNYAAAYRKTIKLVEDWIDQWLQTT